MTNEANQTESQQSAGDKRKSQQGSTNSEPATNSKPPPGQCKALPDSPATPELPKPQICPKRCKCPPQSPTISTYFDKLIQDQAGLLTEADRAKSFKADLEDIQKKAIAAQQDYTVDKRKALVEKWVIADNQISILINKLVRSVPCWDCLLECRICPLLYSIQELEDRLNGNGTLTTQVYSLYDLHNWQDRNLAARQGVFDRIKAVLAAWEKPAVTIAKSLDDNQSVIDLITKNMTADPTAALYDAFIRLIPMHWSIRPRDVESKIDKKYINICSCYDSEPDDCCGPDVGRSTVHWQLLGPQPYLVEVDKLFHIICCLVAERYSPAKAALAKAEVELGKTDRDIAKVKSDIESKKKSLPGDFKLGLENPPDCGKYTAKDEGVQQKPLPPVKQHQT